MNLSHEEEENSLSLSKFESMLKTNKVFFFDSEEFEDIILHYMDTGRLNLAKKALKLGLEQHPKSTGLKLVQVEMLVYEDKLDIAEKLLNELYAIEPTNEEIYIQKANINLQDYFGGAKVMIEINRGGVILDTYRTNNRQDLLAPSPRNLGKTFLSKDRPYGWYKNDHTAERANAYLIDYFS